MRKLSLDDGEMSVEILPDCHGALSAVRWAPPGGDTVNLLRPADAADIMSRDAAQMSCVPVAAFSGPAAGQLIPHPREQAQRIADFPGSRSWTVQDSSNVRATLTLHEEGGYKADGKHALPWAYQALQRFELRPNGLRMQLTVTNTGVRPLPLYAGFRLRLAGRGETVLRGALAPIRTGDEHNNGPTEASLAKGYHLPGYDVSVRLRKLGPELRVEWPEERLAIKLTTLQGFEYAGLEYAARRQNIWLTLLSHNASGAPENPGASLLQQGDSLEEALLLAASGGG